MQMDAGLDTGAMRLIGRTPVDGKTAGELTDELADMGAALMVKVLDDLHAFAPEPQPGTGATYAAKIDKSEARSEAHTSELQSLMRNSYAFFCLNKKNKTKTE